MLLSREKGEARWRNPDDRAPVHSLHRDETAIVCVFPHRQLRARRPPRIHHLGVAPLAARQPLKEIDNQVFDDAVGHLFSHLEALQIYRIARDRIRVPAKKLGPDSVFGPLNPRAFPCPLARQLGAVFRRDLPDEGADSLPGSETSRITSDAEGSIGLAVAVDSGGLRP
jgi:hypothetical protein